MNTFSWWSYPYIKFLENYVPLAFLILFLFCFLLCIFGLINYVAIKKNKSYIKARVIWQGNIISDMFRYFVYAILIMAFAETDKEYILYKIIKDSISFFRQIDAFLYAVFLLQFIMALRFKNCYTYINKLLNSLVFVNFIEIIALVFLKYNNGEKGTLSTGLRLVLIFFVIFLNCILINTKFCNYTRHSNLKVNESDLFKTRVNQMDEILSKIVTYDKEEQITIFLSDEWGGGKTFFAKYLFNQLRKASNYNLIWVNLTDFSQEEVFIKQVFKKIQGELNNKSYYTGESSEFEKYLSAALNISLDQSVANVISEKVAVNNKSKIEKNALLSEMSDEISEMLGNDRIVILIDDMDRCTDETIKAALKLFSEIIFLPKSIIIFVGDYKQLLSKPGFEDGFFDKYFMFNYNLCKVPFRYLLNYYSYLIDCEIKMSFDVSKEIEKLIYCVEQWCMKEDNHGIAENENINRGDIRNFAVKELSTVVDNMKIGILELKKRLSNPRRVIRLYQEIAEQLKKLNQYADNYQMVYNKLEQSIYPAILFYSLARTICTDRFWNICANDFINFEEDVLEVINKMGEPYYKEDPDEILYMLLVYYFISTRFQSDGNRIKEFKKYYTFSNHDDN